MAASVSPKHTASRRDLRSLSLTNEPLMGANKHPLLCEWNK
jgi:hypothetical protein